jgi:hypothetical protein
MTNFDRSQHPTLNDNLDFRKDLAKLLQKYNAEIVSEHDEDLQFIIKGVGCYQLNEKGANCANATNINGLEPKKKRERKRKIKNPLRRWIYEYDRYNPQLGCSVRKGEVYAKTQREAERTATRHCDDYTAYGSITFKRLVQVSDPITVDVDVKEVTRKYGEYPREKEYREYEEIYRNHTESFNKLTDLASVDA